MGIQAFVPSGGGGTPGFDYIASIRMETYNRSWTQSGAAGNYVLTSNNMNNGYAYFVGPGGTTGIPLGQIVNLTDSFTRIDIVAPTNDYISLYKVAVKSTSVFNNALAAFSSFPSVISSSGNFVLPNNALPLVNVLLGGAGGGGGTDGHGGGGGGGGGVVKLTAYQAVGTTAIVIGGGAGGNSKGGDTYFGNVYALGGSAGGHHSQAGQTGGANGGGAGGHATNSGGAGVVQTSSTGLGTKGSPTYSGGYSGGSVNYTGNDRNRWRGGGGGGSNGAGFAGLYNDGGRGGAAHIDTTHGTGTISIGSGGYGCAHHGGHNDYGDHSGSHYGHGGRGAYGDGWGAGGGGNGVVVVRYYIP